MARMPKLLFLLMGELFGLGIAILLMFFTDFDISYFLNRQLLLSFVAIIGIYLLYDYLNQTMFMQEKISKLMVYENLNSVFVIIA